MRDHLEAPDNFPDRGGYAEPDDDKAVFASLALFSSGELFLWGDLGGDHSSTIVR